MISKAAFFILVLTVAFIIGFVTAWLYFRRKWKYPLGELQGETLKLSSKVNTLEAERDELKVKLKQKQVVNSQANGNDITSKMIPEQDFSNEAFLAEKQELTAKHDSLVKENEIILVKMESLQKQLEECQQSKLKSLMFTDANPAEKDDLKLIHGIGPFIEGKLNKIGIYHFRQISAFDQATIDKVTNAIEFFPGRIERDNWMGQATQLEKEKSKS